MGSERPSRAGSRPEPCLGRHLRRRDPCGIPRLPGRDRALQALPDASTAILGGHRSRPGARRADRSDIGSTAHAARPMARRAPAEAQRWTCDASLSIRFRGHRPSFASSQGRDQLARALQRPRDRAPTFRSALALVLRRGLDLDLRPRRTAWHQASCALPAQEGRDLFDLWWAASHASVDFDRVVSCFRRYVESGGRRISRAELETNLASKLEDRVFTADLQPLLAPGVEWDLHRAARLVLDEIAPRLPGEAWRGP